MDGRIRRNIIMTLNNSSHTWQKNATASQIVKWYYQAPSQIKKAIEPYGYFNTKVFSYFQRAQETWFISFNVVLGPPTIIRALNVTVVGDGRNDLKINNFIEKLPIKRLDVFQADIYNDVKTKLLIIAKNSGFLKARYQNEIIINRQENYCKIKIKLLTGKQYYFGHIILMTRPYSYEFLKRVLTIDDNQVFSSEKLLTLQQVMENSYYFKNVVFEPEFNQIRNREVPIKVYLYPPYARRYDFGVGYGTLSGPRLSSALSLRHINNEGQHLEAQLQLSSILSSAAINYFIPGEKPLTEEILLGANYKHFQPKSGKSDTVTFTSGYSKKWGKLQTNLNLNLLYEHFKIELDNNHPRQSHLFFPSLKINYLNTDTLVNPSQAQSINLVMQGGLEPVLSTVSFLQVLLHSKFILSPVNFAKFIFRGDLGYTATQRLTYFPFSLRFFAGGVNTIRGFQDSGIGPGKYLDVGSIEYQNKLYQNIYGALFYDVGAASNHFNMPINRGAGIGLVYYSMIGPIQLYWAKAISKPGHPNSIEFSVGPIL